MHDHPRLKMAVVVVLNATLLTGCTSLHVHRHNSDDADAPRAGYAYMLDYTQFDVALTRTLIECSDEKGAKIKVEATVSPSQVPDGDHVYVIDPASMISAFKTSDISIDYKDGRLIGFNATAEDKTAEVVKSLAMTAGRVAALALDVSLPTAATRAFAPVLRCNADAKGRLQAVEANGKLLKGATTEVETANAELTVLLAQLAAKPSVALQRKIAAKQSAIKTAQGKVDELTKKVKADTDWLTSTTSFVWPETSKEFESAKAFALSAQKTGDWIDRNTILDVVAVKRPPDMMSPQAHPDWRVVVIDRNEGRLGLRSGAFAAAYPNLAKQDFDLRACDSGAEAPACGELTALRRKIAEGHLAEDGVVSPVSLHIVRRGSYGSVQSGDGSSDAKAGLRYRVPAAAWVYACEGMAKCWGDGATPPIAKFPTTISQLGSVFTLPFSSPLFASGNVKLTFDENGRLVTAGLKRTNAAALSAADALGAVSERATALDQAREGRELAELNREIELATARNNLALAGINNEAAVAAARKTLADALEGLEKSPKEQLEEELAILEAQKKVADARAALGPDRVKALTTEVAIARLEVDLADLQRKLAQDPNADQEAVKARYDAEASVINAEKSKLEAELALLEADRKLREARGSP